MMNDNETTTRMESINSAIPSYPTVEPNAKNDAPFTFWHNLKPWVKVVMVLGVLIVSMSITISMFSGTSTTVTEPTVQVPVTVETPKPVNADLNLDGLKGQYWSNVQKILESRGADTNDMLVTTNNGKTPIMDSNWIVTNISKQSNGRLAVELTQVTDYTREAGDAANGLKDKATQTWNDLVQQGKDAGAE